MINRPSSPETKRQAAAALAEELLTDVELSRVPAIQLARKASRLARLLDDADAVRWLRYEASGFTQVDSQTLTADAFRAAWRSGRGSHNTEGKPVVNSASLGQLEAEISAGMAQLAAASDPDVSLSSANPNQYVGLTALGNTREREGARVYIGSRRALVDKVTGVIHDWVAEKHQELRFGAAVEGAFEVLRRDVDAAIAQLVPEGLGMVTAALENVSSDLPEHWSNAASTCRRLLKAAADTLRPAGPDVDGRKMGDRNYINRLVTWLAEQDVGETQRNLISADLDYLGRRLHATDDAGHKGAHATVTREQASRFVVGTYITMGDLLRVGGRLPENQIDPSADDKTALVSEAEPGSD